MCVFLLDNTRAQVVELNPGQMAATGVTEATDPMEMVRTNRIAKDNNQMQ